MIALLLKRIAIANGHGKKNKSIMRRLIMISMAGQSAQLLNNRGQ